MEINKIKNLNKEQLLQCIKQSGFADVANILSMEDVDGETLMTMPEIYILHWKMPIGERKKVVKFINEVKQNPSILIRSKSNATTTKPAIPTSHDPKPPRLSKIITKPPIPLPEGARRSVTKDTNLTKNDYASAISYIEDCPRRIPDANVLVYDNEQMKDNFEELPKTKMNNLENDMLEPEESYIEMGNNLSNHEDYLTPNRSLLTIENQLEEPNYEAPPEKPIAPSPIKVGSASDKKVKLKLGARKLPALPATPYQSQNKNLNNNQISVNVEKQCNKPPGSLSFLHGTLMKNLLSKQKKVVVGNTSEVEDDVKHQEEAKSVPKSLPEILNIKQHAFKGLKKTSEKECKPPLMPKANKPLPRLPLQDDHEAIYENATDQEMYGNVVTTDDLAILRRKYQKNASPTSAKRESKIEELALKLAVQLKNRETEKKCSDLEADNTDDEFDSVPVYGNTSQNEDIYQNNIEDATDMEDNRSTKFLNRPLPNIPNNEEDDDEDEIYDCFKKNDPFSLFKISNESYFRNVDRKGAKSVLAEFEDGAFLFRPSKTHFLALTIKYKAGNRHFGIEKVNNKLRLDAETGSEVPDFESLKEFVDYFTVNPISFESVDHMIEVYLKPVLSSNKP